MACGSSHLSAYHWLAIVRLAWFSYVTHLAGVTRIRNLLRCHPFERIVRFIAMFILLLILIVAYIPTGMFNWHSADSLPKEHRENWLMVAQSARPDSPAICFFDYGTAWKILGTQ